MLNERWIQLNSIFKKNLNFCIENVFYRRKKGIEKKINSKTNRTNGVKPFRMSVRADYRIGNRAKLQNKTTTKTTTKHLKEQNEHENKKEKKEKKKKRISRASQQVIKIDATRSMWHVSIRSVERNRQNRKKTAKERWLTERMRSHIISFGQSQSESWQCNSLHPWQ